MRIASLLTLTIFCLATPTFAQDEKPEAKQDKPATKTPAKKVSAPPKKPEKAPEKYYAVFDTTKGRFVIEVTRKWAPIGADHFYNVIKSGYYDGARFFRVMPGFVVQWGLAADPKATANWRKTLKDERVMASNMRGYVTYAKTEVPNTRSTQVYINLGDNKKLDEMGFSPFGKVVSGLDEVVNKFYSGYDSRRISQRSLTLEGDAYLEREYPKLDKIKKAVVMKENPALKKQDASGADKPAAKPEK